MEGIKAENDQARPFKASAQTIKAGPQALAATDPLIRSGCESHQLSCGGK
jgi:hypothetical protein